MTGKTEAASLAQLVEEVKAASGQIADRDKATQAALDALKAAVAANDNRFAANDNVLKKIQEGVGGIESKTGGLETSINDLWKKIGRPGAETTAADVVKERIAGIELCRVQHEMKVTKKDAQHPFNPSDDDIKSAIAYRKALPALMSCPNIDMLPGEIRKSLSAFAFGANAFILAPEMSNQVIRCIVDPTDLGGLMSSMTISAPSVRFMIDNQRMALAAWACEASCFANNPQPDLNQGLGEMEIKPETLRYIVCASRDLLEDASINIEQWMLNKVSDGFRATINNSLIMGDGVGKPMGLLNPNAGLPICDVALTTPPGQFTWQDVVMLKYEIPMQWQAGSSYLMNQRTFALLMTMSDTNTRPIWGQLPGGEPGFMIAGSPINIATQMPDVAPGATPIAFGNWQRVYMIVWRKAITMQQDPYSAGFCVLYKFDARVGGGILCPNAARLLRIR